MKKKQQTSREVRNENRRFQAAIALFQDEVSDLLKFNQLQVIDSFLTVKVLIKLVITFCIETQKFCCLFSLVQSCWGNYIKIQTSLIFLVNCRG